MYIQVRKYQEEDDSSLNQIYQDVEVYDFHQTPQSFLQCTKDEEIYVATIEDQIVGFLTIYEPETFIHMLYIDKQHRKYGVGKTLLAYIESIYDYPFTLKCLTNNINAYHFYIHQGWHVESEGIQDGQSYYLMKKQGRSS